jgi:hypothetical protein
MTRFLVALVLGSFSICANAALLSRLSGQAYYDDVLDITWLTDANYAATSGYTGDNGHMNWHESAAWIEFLNSSNFLGVNQWRLPKVVDTGSPGCDGAYGGTDCGYNVEVTTGEMAHLFFSTLNNISAYDRNGTSTGCGNLTAPCLTNVGPFENLLADVYWYGQTYRTATDYAWEFHFRAGDQSARNATVNFHHAWPVMDGDIGAVPIPAAFWLFGSALGLLGWMKRRVNS